MTALYTFDGYSTLDGYGSYGPEGDWGGSWGKQGPEFLDRRVALCHERQRLVLGANPMIVEHVVLADDDPYARKTTDATRVEPRRVSPAAAIDGLHPVTLPPVSWSMLIVRQSTTHQ